MPQATLTYLTYGDWIFPVTFIGAMFLTGLAALLTILAIEGR